MRYRFKISSVCCLIGLFWVSPAFAIGGTVKSTFGDWSVRCEQQQGASGEQCALVQNVSAEDRPGMSLAVVIVNGTDVSGRILRIILPLGVLIPSGLGLRIDDTDIGKTGFIRCIPSGCIAEVTMGDTLINQFKTGKTALFIVFQGPDDGVGIPISLANFAEGLAALP
ncbi:MAG: invasion associated locus B family protein [Hyphomicrobiales bacterium]